MQYTCPNCGADKVTLVSNIKTDSARDVQLGAFGIGACNLPKMKCKKCGHTWDPYNYSYNLKDLLK